MKRSLTDRPISAVAVAIATVVVAVVAVRLRSLVVGRRSRLTGRAATAGVGRQHVAGAQP